MNKGIKTIKWIFIVRYMNRYHVNLFFLPLPTFSCQFSDVIILTAHPGQRSNAGLNQCSTLLVLKHTAFYIKWLYLLKCLNWKIFYCALVIHRSFWHESHRSSCWRAATGDRDRNPYNITLFNSLKMVLQLIKEVF